MWQLDSVGEMLTGATERVAFLFASLTIEELEPATIF